jgi:hypothetical protein
MWLMKRIQRHVINLFSAQLTSLWYRATNWLAGLNLNISVNTREYFTLADFRATLHTNITAATMKIHIFRDATRYSLAERYQGFGGTCSAACHGTLTPLQPHTAHSNPVRGSNSRLFQSWKWRQKVPLNLCPHIPQDSGSLCTDHLSWTLKLPEGAHIFELVVYIRPSGMITVNCHCN